MVVTLLQKFIFLIVFKLFNLVFMIFILLVLANFNCSGFNSWLLVTIINFTLDLIAYSIILYLLLVINISFGFNSISSINVVER